MPFSDAGSFYFLRSACHCQHLLIGWQGKKTAIAACIVAGESDAHLLQTLRTLCCVYCKLRQHLPVDRQTDIQTVSQAKTKKSCCLCLNNRNSSFTAFIFFLGRFHYLPSQPVLWTDITTSYCIPELLCCPFPHSFMKLQLEGVRQIDKVAIII